MCIAFTALDGLRAGYEVYPVVDAIAGTSPEAHRAGRSAGSPSRASFHLYRGEPRNGPAPRFI